jgi:hypothetical protein
MSGGTPDNMVFTRQHGVYQTTGVSTGQKEGIPDNKGYTVEQGVKQTNRGNTLTASGH